MLFLLLVDSNEGREWLEPPQQKREPDGAVDMLSCSFGPHGIFAIIVFFCPWIAAAKHSKIRLYLDILFSLKIGQALVRLPVCDKANEGSSTMMCRTSAF